jgi:hypothetical protein
MSNTSAGVVPRPVCLTVNGRASAIEVEPRTTLLDALRDELELTGTKKACDRGECGACTVHVDGRRILSCMTLAIMQEGKRITTIEGLERNGNARSGRVHRHDASSAVSAPPTDHVGHRRDRGGEGRLAERRYGRSFEDFGTLNDLSKAEIRERMGNFAAALPSQHRRRRRQRRGGVEPCILRPFRADDPATAIVAHPRPAPRLHRFGGTDLLGLIGPRAARQSALDINGLPDTARIEPAPDGGLRIGAWARMSDGADPEVRRRFPLVAEALPFSARPVAQHGLDWRRRSARCAYFTTRTTSVQQGARLRLLGTARPQPQPRSLAGPTVRRGQPPPTSRLRWRRSTPSWSCADRGSVQSRSPTASPAIAGRDNAGSRRPDRRDEVPARPGVPAPSEAARPQSYEFALVSVAPRWRWMEGASAGAARFGRVAHKPWRLSAAEAAPRHRADDSGALSGDACPSRTRPLAQRLQTLAGPACRCVGARNRGRARMVPSDNRFRAPRSAQGDGGARYTADIARRGAAHVAIVHSTIAKVAPYRSTPAPPRMPRVLAFSPPQPADEPTPKRWDHLHPHGHYLPLQDDDPLRGPACRAGLAKTRDRRPMPAP